MSILPSPTKFQWSSKLATTISDSCIRPYLDSTTACTIATFSVHFKLDYCNSLYYNLPKSQITGLQLIQNSLARAVVKAPKSCLTLSSLAQNNQRIEYKLLSLAYKVLTTTQPLYLHHLISVQPPRNTSSSSLVTLALSPTSSSLRITDRLIAPFGMPHLVFGINFLVLSVNLISAPVPCVSVLPVHAHTTSSHSVNSPLSPSITPSLFHSRLKTYLFHKSFPP